MERREKKTKTVLPPEDKEDKRYDKHLFLRRKHSNNYRKIRFFLRWFSLDRFFFNVYYFSFLRACVRVCVCVLL